MHDFPDQQLEIAIPHGARDLARDEGWVNVGIDHDTAEFAVENSYEHGIKVSDTKLAAVRIRPDAFHGDWNYQILPRER